MENIILLIYTLVILTCICLMIVVMLTRKKDIRSITNVNKKLKQYMEGLKDVRTKTENSIRW